MLFADFTKAFGYREVYPFRTENAPALNPDEFKRDIVLQIKCGVFNIPFVYDPHYSVMSTSAVS